MEDLRKRNIFCTGTLKAKSSGFPDSIKSAKVKNRGEWTWKTLIGAEYSFACLKWKDTKDVLMVSSYWPPHVAATVRNFFIFLFFSFSDSTLEAGGLAQFGGTESEGRGTSPLHGGRLQCKYGVRRYARDANSFIRDSSDIKILVALRFLLAARLRLLQRVFAVQ